MKRLIAAFIILFLSAHMYSQFGMKPAFPNMTFPFITELVSANDGSGRIFLLTQRGVIYVFPDSAETSYPKVFLDLTDSV